MSAFQIWGSFTKDDPEFPTTVSTFRKGQLTPSGKSMVDFEREFSEEEGEELVLLYEFDPIQHLADREVHEHHPSDAMEAAIAHLVSNAFMEGWFRRKDDDDADGQDEP
jgi:hypothetical protein